MSQANIAITVNYKNLESRLYTPESVRISLRPTQGIELQRGIEKGRYVVKINTPFKIYKLGTYETEEEQTRAFDDYDKALQGDYSLVIFPFEEVERRKLDEKLAYVRRGNMESLTKVPAEKEDFAASSRSVVLKDAEILCEGD